MATNSTGPGIYKVYQDEDAKLKTYKQRIKRAHKRFEVWEPQARKNFRRYRTELEAEQITPSGHRISTPHAISMIDSIYASLTSFDVTATVTNAGHGTRDQARLVEQVLRKEWQEARISREVGAAAKDAAIAGVGWVKVGYEYHEHEAEVARTPEDIAADVNAYYDAAMAAGQPPPDPQAVASKIPQTETKVQVLRDHIVVDHVPWDEILWDPNAKHVKDLRWICQVTKLPTYEVQQNPTWRDYVQKRYQSYRKLDDLKADSTISENGEDGGLQISPPNNPTDDPANDDNDRVTVYELWDFETGMVCTFTKGSDFFLNEQPNPFAIQIALEDRNPFVPLILRTDPEKVKGISDMDAMVPTLDELNEYRSNLATYLSRFVSKLLGPEDGLTEAGKKALQSKEWGAYVEMASGKVPSEFQPIVPPSIPQEMLQIPARLQEDLREVTGVNQLMSGLLPLGRQTATETMSIMQASSIRQSEKRNALTAFYEHIAKRVVLLMQMMYDKPRIARMVEDTGDIVWQWSNEDLLLETQIEIGLTPTEEKTEKRRSDNAMQILNLLTPLAGQGGFVDLPPLYMWALEEMGLRRDDIRTFIKTQEEVQQEQQQQMEQMQQAQQGAGGQPGQPSPADAAGTINPALAAALAGRPTTSAGVQGTSTRIASPGPAVPPIP